MIAKLFSQLKQLTPTMFWIYGPTSVLLVGMSLVAHFTRMPLRKIFSDPASITNSHPLLGFVSNLGIVLWCATAAICLYSAALLRKRGDSGELASFFQYAGLLTTFLMLDDLFLFHERLAQMYFHVPQIAVVAAYGVATLVFLIRFRELILRTEFVLLGSAFAFFAFSLLVDQVLDEVMPMEHLFEDGSKFLGILGWLAYFTRTTFQALGVHNSAPSHR